MTGDSKLNDKAKKLIKTKIITAKAHIKNYQKPNYAFKDDFEKLIKEESKFKTVEEFIEEINNSKDNESYKTIWKKDSSGTGEKKKTDETDTSSEGTGEKKKTDETDTSSEGTGKGRGEKTNLDKGSKNWPGLDFAAKVGKALLAGAVITQGYSKSYNIYDPPMQSTKSHNITFYSIPERSFENFNKVVRFNEKIISGITDENKHYIDFEGNIKCDSEDQDTCIISPSYYGLFSGSVLVTEASIKNDKNKKQLLDPDEKYLRAIKIEDYIAELKKVFGKTDPTYLLSEQAIQQLTEKHENANSKKIQEFDMEMETASTLKEKRALLNKINNPDNTGVRSYLNKEKLEQLKTEVKDQIKINVDSVVVIFKSKDKNKVAPFKTIYENLRFSDFDSAEKKPIIEMATILLSNLDDTEKKKWIDFFLTLYTNSDDNIGSEKESQNAFLTFMNKNFQNYDVIN